MCAEASKVKGAGQRSGTAQHSRGHSQLTGALTVLYCPLSWVAAQPCPAQENRLLHLPWEAAPVSTAMPQSPALSLCCWSQRSPGLSPFCPSVSRQHRHARLLQKSCLLQAAQRQRRHLGTSTAHTTGTREMGSAKRAPRGLARVTVQQDIKDGARGSCHIQSCPRLDSVPHVVQTSLSIHLKLFLRKRKTIQATLASSGGGKHPVPGEGAQSWQGRTQERSAQSTW